MDLGKAVASIALLALAACADDSGQRARDLLPDLDQVAPAAISVVEKKGRERLVFLSSVENVGAGPLLVSGRRESVDEPGMSATQLVRRSDQSTETFPLRAKLRFIVSETHRHWHLLGFEGYELRSEAGRALGRDHKTGFCLGDRYDAHVSRRLPGEPARAVWTQECGRGQIGRLRILEGLSPGFGDDYVPLLEGQYIDVTGLAPGRYLLVHRVNADHDIREASYANNAASVLLDLERDSNGRAAVSILATCPQSPTCG
jgi:Lysyl oxidase